jgi:hypothetical protein
MLILTLLTALHEFGGVRLEENHNLTFREQMRVARRAVTTP